MLSNLDKMMVFVTLPHRLTPLTTFTYYFSPLLYAYLVAKVYSYKVT